jgi:ketosteroid isomerase-like protein
VVDALSVVERLVAASNAHDVEAMVACFAPDYVNETPTHPTRGFRGREQVRRNWTTILGAVPDLTARVIAAALDGDRVWTEWEMTGTRLDGEPHAMAGVVIFGVAGDQIVSARFFLEPVETVSGDVDAAIDRALNRPGP